MARIFVYDGRRFPDPDPQISVDEVRRQLSVFFPELTNADVREERRGEDTLYTFSKRIGTKGTPSSPRRSDLAPRPSLPAPSLTPLPSGLATGPWPLATALRSVPEARLHVFELVHELVDADGELDVEAAGLRQPEIALALAEVEVYVQATRRALKALRRLM